jgi:uncharacterized membrane protein HdeD (DUF308 family)
MIIVTVREPKRELPRTRVPQGGTVIVLGIICLIVGFLLGIHILWAIGIALLVIGAILFLLGRAGHAIGGRSHWY